MGCHCLRGMGRLGEWEHRLAQGRRLGTLKAVHGQAWASPTDDVSR